MHACRWQSPEIPLANPSKTIKVFAWFERWLAAVEIDETFLMQFVKTSLLQNARYTTRLLDLLETFDSRGKLTQLD